MRIWCLHLGRWVSMSESVPDGWKSVRLADVAEEISDRVDDPSKSGYDRFVGLDHLDSGELTIRRWGSTAGLLSAMKLFKSGDILIGRRNAYLKRASKAEFDGVCSGDAYVVREKPGTIAKGLLPIILNSDSFWDYTIAHASGTMSKRAKWRDLAEYSFHLPSPEEQRWISTLIWAAEDCIVKGERFVVVAEREKQVLMGELFSKGIGHREFQKTSAGMLPKGWKVASIKDIGDFKTGPFGTLLKAAEYIGGDGIPLICMRDIRDGRLEIDERTPRIPSSVVKRMPEYLLKCGDIVFGRKGNINRSAIVNDHQDGWFLGTDGIRIRPSKEFYPPFISYHFQRDEIQFHLLHQATGTTMASLNQEILHRMYIPVPSLPEQHQIAAILTRCDEMIAATRANLVATTALKMKIINEMLLPDAIE